MKRASPRAAAATAQWRYVSGGGAESAGAAEDPGSAGACGGPAAGTGAGAPAPGTPPSPASALMRRTVSWPGAGEAQGASRRTGRAMGNDGSDRARRTARASIPSVVVTGLGTYRRSFWRIVIAAVLVFAPIDLVVTLGDHRGHRLRRAVGRPQRVPVDVRHGPRRGRHRAQPGLLRRRHRPHRRRRPEGRGGPPPRRRPAGAADPAPGPRQHPDGRADGRRPAAVPAARPRRSWSCSPSSVP